MKKENKPGFPPKNILVPLDLSETSAVAWKQAQILAQKFKAVVKGLYVQEWVYPMGPENMEPYLTLAIKRAALKDLRARFGDHAKIRAATGLIGDQVLSWEKQFGCDLVVMGTHGRTGWRRVLQGSIAESIVRHSPVPVFVARQASARFRSILVPLNFESYSMEGLSYAAQTAEALGARVTAMHVVDSPVYGNSSGAREFHEIFNDMLRRLPERLRRVCGHKLRLAFGRPAEQIVLAAEDFDLVVLAAHRKGFLNDAILGTTAERVLRHCPKPVLAVPVHVLPERSKNIAMTAETAAA